MGKILEDVIAKDKIRYNEPMSKHTTMKVGGAVDIMVVPDTVDEIINVIKYSEENNIPIKVIGNGSNLIVSDLGVEGIIIKLTSNMSNVNIDGEYVIAIAGTSMPKIAVICKQNSLSGFEFACGIPGTIAGGVKMNSGAYDGQLSDVFVSCKYLDSYLNIKEIENKDMNYSYRHSVFIDNPNYTILEVKLKLNKSNSEDIDKKMKENNLSRKTKQPLEYPNAGSVFRRPAGYFVGKLIQDCNLRGVSIGGAQVSEKHTGFIVNKGNATCEDVRNLIKHIQKTVYEKFSVELKTEVEFIGRF
ncbi:MAG: UDP-N-acetylmuramate dehydrogenase [Clostridia bacterium]|nr:UDP-N-acetylmuramate dehydrogenase [Clostridia bacterium]MDD4387293.1 UDP-N-acetylmuramate dehydrogenase [Clostridia bacterium]